MRWLNLAFAVLAVPAPMAHVLELPNKLALDGPLWLAIQQQLYRGWGPSIGAPTELGTLITTVVLSVMRWRTPRLRHPTLVALGAGIAMLACFFTLNAPVNTAVAVWTPASLPADWSRYRAIWEAGHALSAVCAIVALAALVTALVREQRP